MASSQTAATSPRRLCGSGGVTDFEQMNRRFSAFPSCPTNEGTKRHDFGISNDSVRRAPLSLLFLPMPGCSRSATELGYVLPRGCLIPNRLGAVPAVTGAVSLRKGTEGSMYELCLSCLWGVYTDAPIVVNGRSASCRGRYRGCGSGLKGSLLRSLREGLRPPLDPGFFAAMVRRAAHGPADDVAGRLRGIGS